MHYQLFLPNWPQASVEQQDAQKRIRGVDDILTGQFDTRPEQEGPSNLYGLLVAWLSPQNTQHLYKPEKQIWLPSLQKLEGGIPAYYVGLWKDNLPTESELRRPYTQEGVWTQLGGEKWKVPTPRTVEAKAIYREDGTMFWEPVRKFAWMCDEAQKLADKLLEPGEYGGMYFTFQDNPQQQIDWLVKLLRVNYRMLPELAAYLELWSGRKRVLDAFLSTLGLSVKGAADGNED